MKHYFYTGILACGLITALASAQTDGTLDPLFGSNGEVISSYGVSSFQSSIANAVMIQNDDKILVTGNILIAGTYYMPIARFNSDGTPDATFGTNGVNLSVSGAVGQALVIQPNGKIVVCGYTQNTNLIILRRFNTDGSLDATFTMTPSIGVNGGNMYMALQDDGKILVAAANNSAILVRYKSDGSLDTSFNQVNSFFGYQTAYFVGVFLQNDGKIVTVGGVELAGSAYLLAARYLSNGLPDTSFGTSGFTVASINNMQQDYVYAGALQADGKIIIVAMTSGDSFLGMARLTTQGLLDQSFGANGFVDTTNEHIFIFATSAGLQSDGKIILAGEGSTDNLTYHAGAFRYTANGAFDTSFGKNGYALTANTNGQLNAVALDAQGSIIGAGYNNGQRFVQINKFTVDSLRYSPLSQAVWERYYNKLN